MARDYQTKSNSSGLPDSITATRFGGGEFNSIATELENAVTTSDQTLAPADGTGEVSTQLAMALAIYGAGGATYHIDTGAVNAYVLTPVSPKESPNAYFNGFSVVFEPGTVNTTASTVNVGGLGVKSITLQNGTALTGGELSGTCCLKYNLSDDRFELIYSSDSFISTSNYYEIDATQADQGATSTNAETYTIYDVATLVGTSKFATIHLSHNPAAGNQTLYTFDTSLDLSTYPNLFFSIDPGAQFDRTTGDEIFTINSPSNMRINLTQKITTADMIRFNIGGLIYPEWFGAVGDLSADDITPITIAVSAASNPSTASAYGTVVFNGRYSISSPINIDYSIGIESYGGATVHGGSTSASCFIASNFSWHAPVTLPILTACTGPALRLNGTSLSSIKVNLIQTVGSGILIETLNASYSTCLDNSIFCQTIADCTGAAIEFYADNAANVIQGNEIYGNFMTNCLYGVYFNASGITPSWDSNQVRFQALDLNNNSNAKCLYSNASDAPRFTFRIETWCGGMNGSGAMFIDGVFNSLNAFLVIADAASAGDWSRWNLTGIHPRVQFENLLTAYDSPISVGTTANQRTAFNSNTPIYSNAIQAYHTLSGDLTDGSTLVLYLYSPIASGFQTLTNRVYLSSATGLVMVERIVDNNATNAHEIAVTVRNIGGSTISSGAAIGFAIGVGI